MNRIRTINCTPERYLRCFVFLSYSQKNYAQEIRSRTSQTPVTIISISGNFQNGEEVDDHAHSLPDPHSNSKISQFIDNEKKYRERRLNFFL